MLGRTIALFLNAGVPMGIHISCRGFMMSLLTLAILACSDVRLKSPEEVLVNVKSQGQFCISDPKEILRYMKFLFVIDKSGSNSQSDPGGRKRSTNIEKFVKENVDKEYYRYSMVAFEGNRGAEAYINDGDQTIPTFTDDLDKVFKATARIQSELEGGSTPYKAALQAVHIAIVNDLKKFPDEMSTYMVFFVSDGQPTDTSNDLELQALIEDIIDLAPNVFLSSAYYGSAGGGAINRLRRMSEEWGRGKFVNFETDANWDFNELVVKPTHEPWQLKNFLVYNLNAGYCEDGKIDTDSDADGMCDRDEIRYSGIAVKGKTFLFDPSKRFSSGGAFGDYFHWRELRYGEVIPSEEECNDRTDDDHDFLTACEERYIKNDRPSENVTKNGDPKSPDTDRDGVIDGLETFVYFTRSLAFAMDSFNLLRSNIDGEQQAGLQIAEHRNPLIEDLDALAYDTKLDKTGDSTRDCYNFSQGVLPLYPTVEVSKGETLPGLEHAAGENSVLVYFIQTPQNDPQGDGVYMYSVQKLLHDPARSAVLSTDAGLKVEDGVFTQYIIPRKH